MMTISVIIGSTRQVGFGRKLFFARWSEQRGGKQ
jgi:hypothetical protein